jgi:hypothetical protein
MVGVEPTKPNPALVLAPDARDPVENVPPVEWSSIPVFLR